MGDFTPKLREQIGQGLLRIDQRIDAARAAIDAARTGRAVELLDEAIDLKERIVRRIPRIDVDGEQTLAFFDVYWLFDELDGLALLVLLMALVIHIDPKEASPGDTKLLRRDLKELEELIEKARQKIIALPWSGSAKQRAVDDLDRKLKQIEDEIERVRKGKEPRREIADELKYFKAAFLDAVSESVSLWDVYFYLRAMDSGLASAQGKLTDRPRPSPDDARKRLREVEDWKHKLERIIDGTDAKTAPRPEREGIDWPFPLPPLPKGQNYV